jgi:SNF2 family DNA or RNA helicase
MLGLSDQKTIPGFNKKIDIVGTHNPLSKEDNEWFQDVMNGDDLELRPHQLTGIVRMVQMAFGIDRHCLLADEVGLGKTIQNLGLACILRFFREYYEKHKKFPGAFGESCAMPSWTE